MRTWAIENGAIISKAGWSPYAGRRGRGAVVATYLRGVKIAAEGKPFGMHTGLFAPGQGY
jgi:dihydroorotase-like cyclic amidohydrolase